MWNLRVLRVDIDRVELVNVTLCLRRDTFILFQRITPILEGALAVSLACVAYGLLEQLLS